MRKYESMVVVTPKMGEEQAKKENQKVLSFITERGGEVEKTDEWGKRDLAYEINDLKEAYYFVNHYQLAPEKVKELEQFFRINETVIRYNIIVLS